MMRTLPSVWDGSIFQAPCIEEAMSIGEISAVPGSSQQPEAESSAGVAGEKPLVS